MLHTSQKFLATPTKSPINPITSIDTAYQYRWFFPCYDKRNAWKTTLQSIIASLHADNEYTASRAIQGLLVEQSGEPDEQGEYGEPGEPGHDVNKKHETFSCGRSVTR